MSKEKIIDEICELMDVMDKMADGTMTSEELDKYLAKDSTLEKYA
jgi:hypothetical protein